MLTGVVSLCKKERAMQIGDVTIWERTFTFEDVQRFGEISGDQGVHHVQPDERGRVMIQGLLTATLPTKLGGDVNFVASTMTFTFLRPVFTGDTICCENTIKQIEKQEGRTTLLVSFICRNQRGKEVLAGHVSGFIRD